MILKAETPQVQLSLRRIGYEEVEPYHINNYSSHFMYPLATHTAKPGCTNA